MKKLSFYGASGEVTGSSYVVTTQSDEKILIDLGMFQGDRETVDLNHKPLPFKPSELKAVILTHAHLDHCGRLPLLIFGGYFGKIYMTEPTAALAEVILQDSARIAQENLDYPPLYSLEEVEKILNMIEIVDYNSSITIGGFTFTLRDAGHILGSASIEIVDNVSHKKVVFSGDLGNSPEDIIRPTQFIDDAHYVVMESTYGDKSHPAEDAIEILKEEINAVEEKSGVLLIPAFSLERTQELLHRIHHLKKDGKIRKQTPVFLDSPMGIRATLIFKQFREFYNEELQSHTDDPFSFEGLVVTEDSRDSREIIRAMEPKVIIAGSGMMSGGRIMHHAANYLSRKSTRLLFVGYQAEETVGRKILHGSKNVKIGKRNIQVKSAIREIASLSSHADQPKLKKWLSHIQKVERVFLIHGETEQRNIFAEIVKNEIGIKDVTLPMKNQEVILS